jgi:hypothetical protein
MRAPAAACGHQVEHVQELQRETRAVEVLELHCNAYLDFGGVNSDVADAGLTRAVKGGVLHGEHLHALAQLCEGAARLQGAMAAVQKVAKGSAWASAVDVLATRCALFFTHCSCRRRCRWLSRCCRLQHV